jgi:hypothetical protein
MSRIAAWVVLPAQNVFVDVHLTLHFVHLTLNLRPPPTSARHGNGAPNI